MTKDFQDIFTPEWMVDELLDHIPLKDGDKVLEPTAGDGNMAEAILKRCTNISIELTVNEIQKAHYDVMKERLKKYGKIIERPFNLFDHFFSKSS